MVLNSVIDERGPIYFLELGSNLTKELLWFDSGKYSQN